jgi:AcrR family transcriptional regulator
VLEMSVSGARLAPEPLAIASGRPFSKRQEEVLDILESIFMKEGFRQTTIQDLAARAKCSRRTLYGIATTKEEMFLLVFDRLMARIDHAAGKSLHSAADPAAKFAELLNHGAIGFRPAGTAFAAELADYAPAHVLFARYLERIRGTVIRIVNEGKAGGAFRDVNPDVVAEVVINATREVNDPAFLARTGMTPAEALTALLSLLQQGLLRTDSESGS